MNNKEFIRDIRKTFDDGLDLIIKKNADYANSDNPFRNFESASVAGVSVERAILIRALDKMSRISNLLDKPPAVVEEKITDTILDCVNYLAILKAKLKDNELRRK